jgi:hypothetical protein
MPPTISEIASAACADFRKKLAKTIGLRRLSGFHQMLNCIAARFQCMPPRDVQRFWDNDMRRNT